MRQHSKEHPPLHLKEAPAIPGQWEAWCWLWRRLLANTPPPTEAQAGADSEPEEDRCTDHADHADHQGRNDARDRTD